MKPIVLIGQPAYFDDPAKDNGATLRGGLDAFGQRGAAPEIVFIVSSGEMLTFAARSGKRTVNELRNRYPKVPVVAVMLGCLGLHGCLLEFVRRKVSTALVILLEYPAKLQQYGLDVLGVGPEGLRAVGGACLFGLQRGERLDRNADEYVVGGCRIFSSTMGMQGMVSLANSLVTYLMQLHVAECDCIVSFELPIGYSERLIILLRRMLRGRLAPDRWRESSETDGEHRLTLKPIIEMQREGMLTGRMATILSLGGGGRLGCIQVGGRGQDSRMLEWVEQPRIELNYLTAIADVHKVMKLLSKSPNSALAMEAARAQLSYMRRDIKSGGFGYSVCELTIA